MIPVRIRMVDFLSYHDETFDFTKIQDATVTGKNGSGKSSFCTDAITWALYGQGSKGGVMERGNYVRQGANSCTIEFTFEMNNNLYKVVRNQNLSTRKASLVLFGITDGGDEVPLSDKTKEAQEAINKMLKMSYETFTASSIVLQNQIHAFTEGMTDTEKKDALLSVLNVGVWDYYKERNAKEVKKLKSEIDVCEGRIQSSKEIVAREPELRIAEARTKDIIASCKTEKTEWENKLVALSDKMRHITTLEAAVGSLRSLVASKEEAARIYQGQKETAERDIASAMKQEETIKVATARLQKILDHGDEIRSAVEKEKELSAKLDTLLQAKTQAATLTEKLESLRKQGAQWNENQNQRIRTLETRQKEKEHQASLVDSVPCAETGIAIKCPLLKMAFQAKDELSAIMSEIISVRAEANPFRTQWKEAAEEQKKAMSAYSEEAESSLRSELEKIRKYSGLLPSLENAKRDMTQNEEMLSEIAKTRKDKQEAVKQAEAGIESAKEEVAKHSSALAEKEKELLLFNESKTMYEDASRQVKEAEKKLLDIQTEQARILGELARINDEKKRIASIEVEAQKWQKQKEIADIFADACNKRNGVPAFMVANAIPELETNANEILERMMDGRLQIHFRTGKDEDSVGALFRIDVQEQSEAVPRDFTTFSGAEKFIIALAIRIAMSKFLAHRAGSSVQLFVLDEGVSCADTENREEIMRAIRSISGDFAKVLFITHDEELKDTLSSRILIRKDSQGSHISLTN